MEQTLPTKELLLPLSALTPDARNARRHPERNTALIAEALAEVGAARSVVIDEDGRVLAGNATLEAARRVGLSSVRVVDGDGQTLIAVRRAGLTGEQKTRLALWDNRAAELAAWDGDALAALLEGGAGLAPLWTEDELTALLGPAELPGYLDGTPAGFLEERIAGDAPADLGDPGDGLTGQETSTNKGMIAAGLPPAAGPLREAAPPAEFPVYDETLPTQYRCPRCAYAWSGQPK